MSETDELFGTPTEEDGGMDFDALFGGDSADPPSDPPSFIGEPQSDEEAEAPVQAEPAADAETVPAAEDSAAGLPAETRSNDTTAPAAEHAPETAAETGETAVAEPGPEPDLFAAFSQDSGESMSESQKEQNGTAPAADQQVSLFDKPAIFKYGSAKEPIKDASMTFEELRIAKADDFPQLEDGKRVSWTVKYGDISKAVTLPSETTIAKMKEDIEKSKAFLDALKKGKLKDPECFLIPQIRAGSKGISAYKGVFPSVEAARKSDKVISLIPSSDGRIYELRKTELGEFVAPKNKVVDFQEVRAGFTPALPLLPRELMGQLIAFFRFFMDQSGELEALALIFWDKEEKRFIPYIPRQTAGKAYIDYRMDEDVFPEERYLHYADIHSHNSMAAEFSAIDDEDEKATRLYLVMGKLNRFYPDITARVSCGGTFLKIDPADVIEGLGEEFPTEWLDRVERNTPFSEWRKGSRSNPLVSKCLKVIMG